LTFRVIFTIIEDSGSRMWKCICCSFFKIIGWNLMDSPAKKKNVLHDPPARRNRYLTEQRLTGNSCQGNDKNVIRLVEEKIQSSRFIDEVSADFCGALVLFLGSVRSPSGGRDISHLLYEAHNEMALSKLKEVADRARSLWKLGGIAIVHRIGKVEPGETSLLIAVSSPHRAEAYEASRFLIEEIKKEVPIWKKECWEGGEEWK
jgi:molybdopterin synthase catalytic subunit